MPRHPRIKDLVGDVLFLLVMRVQFIVAGVLINLSLRWGAMSSPSHILTRRARISLDTIARCCNIGPQRVELGGPVRESSCHGILRNRKRCFTDEQIATRA